MAYTARMAAALSGATSSQLRHWRSARPPGPVLVPEISQSPRVLYSFRDVLALRTCVYLRETVSLQMIRKAIGNLRDLGRADHLSAYRLLPAGDSIQLIGDDDGIDLVKRPGQGQVVAVIADVIEPFPVRADIVVPHLLRPRPHLEVDPEIQGGIPVIANTRVPYDAVSSLMPDVPPEKISVYYPSVSADAAADALDFAHYVDGYDPATRAA